jgi:hypothetical protein
MNEDESKQLISYGMAAAYADMVDKVATKIGSLQKAKVVFPQHVDYYDSVIELYEEEYRYCKHMLRIGREMNQSTIQ